jgi:predicted phage terminase large subunit-like protein
MSERGASMAREMLRRRHARESLKGFCRSIDIPGAPATADPEAEQFKPVEQVMASHHIMICDFIQKVMTTYMGRGMIFAPPGAAKSTYGSVCAPAWHMGRFPEKNLAIISYDTTIAAKQSRKVRSLVRDPLYSCIWDDQPVLRDDQRAVEDWALSTGTGYNAAGILAGITGNRYWGVVIDDPVKNREAADSATVMEKIYDEYVATVTTRLLPGGWVLLIQTRWSEIDLAASILPDDYACESGPIKCKDGQVWQVLCLQAECERNDDPLGRKPGDFIWPEWFPREHWDQWRGNPRAARTWSALYQQRPAPPEGVIFTRKMFEPYRFDLGAEPGSASGRPERIRLYGASDYATTTVESSSTGDPDFTEHGVAGMDTQGDLWLLDWFFEQCETDKGIAAFIRLVKEWKPLRWAHEGGLIDKAIGPAKRRAMREARAFVAQDAFPSIQQKDMKLMSFHARAAAGTIHIPRTAWGDRLIDLLCAFPTAKHDDGPDVCGLMGRLIDKMIDAGLADVDKKTPDLVPFTAAWLEFNERREKPVRYR